MSNFEQYHDPNEEYKKELYNSWEEEMANTWTGNNPSRDPEDFALTPEQQSKSPEGDKDVKTYVPQTERLSAIREREKSDLDNKNIPDPLNDPAFGIPSKALRSWSEAPKQ